ncbi:hypothetical protein ACOSP7_020935 [Xanthoceras sorbifolium]
MTFFKATLSSSFTHSTSNPRDDVSSLSKLFTTTNPKSIPKESVMSEEDRAWVSEFLHGKYESGKINLDEPLYIFDYMFRLQPTRPHLLCLHSMSFIYGSCQEYIS